MWPLLCTRLNTNIKDHAYIDKTYKHISEIAHLHQKFIWVSMLLNPIFYGSTALMVLGILIVKVLRAHSVRNATFGKAPLE